MHELTSHSHLQSLPGRTDLFPPTPSAVARMESRMPLRLDTSVSRRSISRVTTRGTLFTALGSTSHRPHVATVSLPPISRAYCSTRRHSSAAASAASFLHHSRRQSSPSLSQCFHSSGHDRFVFGRRHNDESTEHEAGLSPRRLPWMLAMRSVHQHGHLLRLHVVSTAYAARHSAAAACAYRSGLNRPTTSAASAPAA